MKWCLNGEARQPQSDGAAGGASQKIPAELIATITGLRSLERASMWRFPVKSRGERAVEVGLEYRNRGGTGATGIQQQEHRYSEHQT